MNQIAILQHLCKPETLLEVLEASAINLVHVIDARIPAPDPAGLVDRQVRLPCPLLIHGITRRPVCVVVALNNLWPRDVLSIGDVKARPLVKRLVPGGYRRVCWRVFTQPHKRLGADASGCLLVGVAAARHELETEINVAGLIEGKTTKDEVPAVKAGN